MSRKMDRKRAQMKKQRQHRHQTQIKNHQQAERTEQRRRNERENRERNERRQEELRRQEQRKKKLQAKKAEEKERILQKKAQERARKNEEKEERRIQKESKKRIRKMRFRKATRTLRKVLKVVLSISAVVAAVFCIIYFGFKLNSVEMKENEIYTQQELTDYIFKDGKNKNTFVFWLKAKTGIGKVEIPFLDKYDVKMKSPSKLQLSVYEKSLIGYVEKDGIYIYFDRDGVIEKIATEKIKGIPNVVGIEINNPKLYEKFEVKDEDVYDLLLTVSQAIQKYNFNVKKIEITEDGQASIYIKKVKIEFGKGRDLNEKMIDLSDMIDGGLLKYKGTLNMKSLSTDGSGYTLKENETKTSSQSESESVDSTNQDETQNNSNPVSNEATNEATNEETTAVER